MHMYAYAVTCVQRRQVSVYDRGASFVQDKPHTNAIPKHQERLMRLLITVVVLYQTKTLSPFAEAFPWCHELD
jgi:hypothetical protein